MSHGGLGIDRLVDVRPLAFGGRSDLFAATDLRLDRPVAVRVLPSLTDRSRLDAFVDRARALASISSHPNLVRIDDVGVNGAGRPYLVLELTEGPDLDYRLQADGSMEWTDAIDLVVQLAAGLGAVHEQGWTHRDLRPANVFLSGSGAKLSDVGLLPELVGPGDDPMVLVNRAPESFSGRADHRSDLYSLTSILHQLIDGQPPFWRPDDTVEALLARLAGQAAPTLDPDMVPAALAVFVSAGLSPDPLDRPQSFREFIRELQLIRQGRTSGSVGSVLHDRGSNGVASRPLVGDPDSWAPPRSADRSPAQAEPDTLLLAPTAAAAGSSSDVLVRPTSEHPAPAGEATTVVAQVLEGNLRHLDRTDLGPAAPTEVPPSPLPARSVESSAQDQPRFDPGPADRWPDHPGDGFETSRTSWRSQPDLTIGAGLLLAAVLIGLLIVAAISLGGDGPDTQVAVGPPGDGDEPSASAQEGNGTGPSSTQALAPLAMLQESTTTSISPDPPPSSETTVRRVTVPDLVGLGVEQAGQILADAGFDVLVVGRVAPGSVPGTVIQQTPTAGSTVSLPISVTLFIPRSATLPSMVGRPADTVCLQLTALGLICEQGLRFDERVPAGVVISTEPTEGSAFAQGSTVRLQVSRGPLAEVAVPPVAGRSEEEARTALTDAGFLSIATIATPSDTVPAGQAVGTDPGAGTIHAVDQPVTIQLSSGPPPPTTVAGGSTTTTTTDDEG